MSFLMCDCYFVLQVTLDYTSVNFRDSNKDLCAMLLEKWSCTSFVCLIAVALLPFREPHHRCYWRIPTIYNNMCEQITVCYRFWKDKWTTCDLENSWLMLITLSFYPFFSQKNCGKNTLNKWSIGWYNGKSVLADMHKPRIPIWKLNALCKR